MNYLIEENVVINDFTEYLEEYEINIKNINFEDVNEYLMLCHYDIFDNIESEDIDPMIIIDEIKEEIENIIYKNFNIILEEV